MQSIRSRDTKPEMLVRKYLFSQGFRYRLNSSKLPGHPDLVLRKYRTVIFVNGCFWHGHEGCRYYVMPKTNVDFWTSKIRRNQERDRETLLALTTLGWRCITVWECSLRPKFREQTLAELVSILRDLLSNPRIINLELAPTDLVHDIISPTVGTAFPEISIAGNAPTPDSAVSSAGDNQPSVRPYEIPESPVTRAADPEASYGDKKPEAER